MRLTTNKNSTVEVEKIRQHIGVNFLNHFYEFRRKNKTLDVDTFAPRIR